MSATLLAGWANFQHIGLSRFSAQAEHSEVRCRRQLIAASAVYAYGADDSLGKRIASRSSASNCSMPSPSISALAIRPVADGCACETTASACQHLPTYRMTPYEKSSLAGIGQHWMRMERAMGIEPTRAALPEPENKWFRAMTDVKCD